MISVVKSVLLAYPPMSGVRTYKSINLQYHDNNYTQNNHILSQTVMVHQFMQICLKNATQDWIR